MPEYPKKEWSEENARLVEYRVGNPLWEEAVWIHISDLTKKKKTLKASQARFDGMRKQVKSYNEIGNQALSLEDIENAFIQIATAGL
jgi:hypothetical protein